MSDSFNPQELLSKLRAKSNNSTAASMSSSVVSEQSPKRVHTSTAESEQKASSATKVQATKNIRAPISLTLTPSQRQENLNARLELEKEIKRLQDEVAYLSSENLQLKKDKEDVEQQFMDFKAKNEEIVVKLRGRIAAQALNNSDIQPPDRGSGAGRLYGPANRAGEPISKYPTPHNYSSSRSPTSASKQARYMSTPQSAQHGQGGYHSGGEGDRNLPPPPPAPPLGGFRDPTFSELMRRSTPDHVDFKEALRRNGSTKLGTGLAPNPAAPSTNPHAHGHAQPHSLSHGQSHGQHGQPYQQHNQQHGAGHGGAPHNNAYSGAHNGQSAHSNGPTPSSHAVHSNSNSAQAYSNTSTPNANHSGIGHNQRTKSMSNVLNSPFADMQNEAKGSGYGDASNSAGYMHRQNSIASYAEMDQFLGNIGFAPANNGAFTHSAGASNNGNKGSMDHGSAHGGHGGHSAPHAAGNSAGAHAHAHHLQHGAHHHSSSGGGNSNNNNNNNNHMDYLSAADTSDGEDIPVLEIDLSA